MGPRKVFSTLILLFIGTQARSAELGWIVKVAEPAREAKGLSSIQSDLRTNLEPLVPALGLYLATPQSGEKSSDFLGRFKSRATKDKRLRYTVPNHTLVDRGVTPNDPLFPRQWSMKNLLEGKDVRATDAWTNGRGGTDRNGRDLVVAVVDGGVDINHPDLAGNIWRSSGEIAANGIDDDGNGYVDDVNGWNAYTNTGRLSSSSHGAHVAGIIGARGDNNSGVSGINWNVKIISVDGSSSSTAVILRAYNYLVTQKRKWISSGGRDGANVVATNSSFGVDRARCDSADFRPWNEIYELMGTEGILSATATANQAWDIDAIGDVPTGCASQYLVTVTNTDRNDRLFVSTQAGGGGAGWGAQTIDLGAPGTDIISLLPSSQTGPMTGTSMATPHVAGAIAYLHSRASVRLQALINQDPAAGAREIKRLLLEGTDPIPSLQGRTVSGGRLNLERSARLAAEY